MSNSKTLGGRKKVSIQLIPLAQPFLIAAVLGSIFITMGVFMSEPIIAIGLPLLAMVLYGMYAYKTKHDAPVSIVGDSFYYLGFILTLTSLVASLLFLSVADEININNIVGSFGAALVTTVVGLVARLVVTSFSVQVQERTEKAEEALEKRVLTFSAQLESLTTNTVASLSKVHAETEEALRNCLLSYETLQADMNKRYEDSLSQNAQKVESSINELVRRIGNINIDQDVFSTPLNSALNEVIEVLRKGKVSFDDVMNEMQQSNVRLSEQIKGSDDVIARHVAAMENTFSAQITQSTETYTKVMSAIDAEHTELRSIKADAQKRVSDELIKLSKDIAAVGNGLTNATKPIAENADVIAAMQKQVSDCIESLNEATKQLVEMRAQQNGLLVSSSQIDAAFDRLAKSVPEVREELIKMSQQAVETTSSLQQTSKTVNDSSFQVAKDIQTIYSSLANQIKAISGGN